MIADGPVANLTRPNHNPGSAGTRTMATFQNITTPPDSQAALAFE